MTRILLALWLLVALAVPAQAGPVAAAIGAIVSAVSSFAASFLVQTAFSIGMSMLAQALAPKPKVRAPGIKTDVTQSGGTTPQSFILGFSATGGQLIAPPMTYGQSGDTPNAYLVYVIALGCIPGQRLTRLIVNDKYITISGDPATGMREVEGRYEGYLRIRTHDGRQTAADPFLMAQFGSASVRPWAVDMVGPGVPYAVLRFKYKRSKFNGLPSVRFECTGIPLYDPRKDGSVGGDGLQRWADPSTWASSTNPAVQIYNILRGIPLPDGSVWGGEALAEDLPLAVWAAAMNECDLIVPGETGPQYQAGLEVGLDEEPADIIDELLKACSGQLAEIGGVWKIRVGGPGLPVHFISDDDILVDQDQMLEPFPGLDDTWNGVHAAYPEPASLWETKDAPPRYNDGFELADGGRRLVADLRLPAVPWRLQVQRLMTAYIREERRFRRHRLALPPDAAVLEPLDTIAWTSARNGYTGKAFEIFELSDDLMTLSQSMGLRERDAGDYVWTPADELPSEIADPAEVLPPPRPVPAFAVAATVMSDAAGVARRPAILLTWSGQETADMRGLTWQIRLVASGAVAVSGSTLAVESGTVTVSEGILSATAYEVRAQLVSETLDTVWTDWIAITTPDVLYVEPAILDAMAEAARVPVVATLPVNETERGAVVYLVNATEQRLYQWDAATSAWAAVVDAAHMMGQLTAGQIGAGIIGAEHVRAGSLNADDIQTGKMNARLLDVTELLEMDAENAGFVLGKRAVLDTTDGVYMGAVGEHGFGFAASRTTGAIRQSVTLDPINGFVLRNARHRVTGATLPQSATVTASQTIDLPTGTKSLSLMLLGGGGGGASGSWVGEGIIRGNGANGGATIVQLYDGPTLVGTYEAPGGVGATEGTSGNNGGDGESSSYGTGGFKGTSSSAPTAGSGQGAGGGGGYGLYGRGGKGGKAGSQINRDLDVSLLTAPRLVITIGAPGVGGIPTGTTNTKVSGAAGSAGRVAYTHSAFTDIPADVIPLKPTSVGSFAKAAGATGALFPALGAGFWVLEADNNPLNLGLVEIDSSGTRITINSATFASFVSAKTPVVITGAANARTIRYIHHSMGGWG